MPHNWDHAGNAWYHTYQEQRVAGGPTGNSAWVEDHRVMLAASPAHPQGSPKRMTQILFQAFNPLAIRVASQASLSLGDAPGHTSGVDMVSGGRSPTCCPAMRVTPCPPLLHQDLATGDLTQHGNSFTTAAEQESCLTPRSSAAPWPWPWRRRWPPPCPPAPCAELRAAARSGAHYPPGAGPCGIHRAVCCSVVSTSGGTCPTARGCLVGPPRTRAPGTGCRGSEGRGPQGDHHDPPSSNSVLGGVRLRPGFAVHPPRMRIGRRESGPSGHAPAPANASKRTEPGWAASAAPASPEHELVLADCTPQPAS